MYLIGYHELYLNKLNSDLELHNALISSPIVRPAIDMALSQIF